MAKNNDRRVLLADTVFVWVRAIDNPGELKAVSAWEIHAIRFSCHVSKFGVGMSSAEGSVVGLAMRRKQVYLARLPKRSVLHSCCEAEGMKLKLSESATVNRSK